MTEMARTAQTSEGRMTRRSAQADNVTADTATRVSNSEGNSVPPVVNVSEVSSVSSEGMRSSSSAAAAADFRKHQIKMGNVISEEQMKELLKKFCTNQLFHMKKYFVEPKKDFTPDGNGKTYQLMYQAVGLDPKDLLPATEAKLTKMFKTTVKNVIGSKRSTVVDAMKQRFIGM